MASISRLSSDTAWSRSILSRTSLIPASNASSGSLCRQFPSQSDPQRSGRRPTPWPLLSTPRKNTRSPTTSLPRASGGTRCRCDVCSRRFTIGWISSSRGVEGPHGVTTGHCEPVHTSSTPVRRRCPSIETTWRSPIRSRWNLKLPLAVVGPGPAQGASLGREASPSQYQAFRFAFGPSAGTSAKVSPDPLVAIPYP
jgi:hypothetical protein